MYTHTNYLTKKALKADVANGIHVTYFQPNNIFGSVPTTDGTIYLEGPHYPRPHTWYAQCTVANGIIIKVR